MHWLILKRFDQARERVKAAQRLDPVSFAINEAVEIVDLYSGHVDEAKADARNLQQLYPHADLSNMMRAIVVEELHHQQIPQPARFARFSTIVSQPSIRPASFDRPHLESLKDQWEDGPRRYQQIVRASASAYFPPAIVAMLKGAVYGFKGRMFESAYQQHDPSLLWLRYLEGTGESDLAPILHKIGIN